MSRLPARSRRVVMPGIAVSLLLFDGSPYASARPDLDVDAAIVFAVDMSSSIDPERADFQRIGHVKALRSPEVAAAIARGARGCISITYVEWSVPGWLRTVLPWTRICTDADRQAVADEIDARGDTGLERRGRGGTAVSYALDVSSLLLDRMPGRADRKIIDISANGTNNEGLSVTSARQRVLAKGHIVNAIVIDPAEPGVTDDLPAYFHDNVIGGPASFVVTPKSVEDYAHALKRKLVLEISGNDAAGGDSVVRFAGLGP